MRLPTRETIGTGERILEVFGLGRRPIVTIAGIRERETVRMTPTADMKDIMISY